MTRRQYAQDSLRLQNFVFPASSSAPTDSRTAAPSTGVAMSPEQHQQHQQMLYEGLQAMQHSPVHTEGPWATQGFPPHAFLIPQSSHDPAVVSQPHQQPQPPQLTPSSSSTSVQSGSPPSTSASARPRTRSQTKRDAQAAMAAVAMQAGLQMPPPPVPPLPSHVSSAAPSGSSESTGGPAGLSLQTRRNLRTTTEGGASLPRSMSDPSALGGQGVKTRQRARREAEEIKPSLSLQTLPVPPVDQSPSTLSFPSSMSTEASPQTSVHSATQSPIAFAHPSHPSWAHLSYTPTSSRTMTPTSTTPSLHSSTYSTSSLSPPSLPSTTTSSGSSSRRPPKRKAKLTNHLRKEMLEFADKYPKMTQTEIGIRFYVERSTVSKTLKNRHVIMRDLEDGKTGPKNRPTKYPDVEEQMTPWVARLTDQSIQITDAMIREKALQIAESLGHTPRFKASVGWVSGFKTRHHIRKGIVGGLPTTEDEKMEDEEEEEAPSVSKRRRTDKMAAPTPGEATEEETEREEETSTLANSSQFSSGFSDPSSSSATAFEAPHEYVDQGDHDMESKAESRPATAGGTDMVLEESVTQLQQHHSRARAFSDTSVHTMSPAHMQGFASPGGSFDFHASFGFQHPRSETMSNSASPVQSTLRSDGFLFPALAEDPPSQEQPGTPSTEMGNMVLFTPPHLTRSGTSRNTLHAYVPSTDTIMEDEEPGLAEAPSHGSAAGYHNSYGQLGTPFALATSSPINTMGPTYSSTLVGFNPMQGQLSHSHSHQDLTMASQSTSHRAAPPPLQHTMSEMSVPQVADSHRSNRLQRSRSQSEVLFSSRGMFSAEATHVPDFRLADLARQQSGLEYPSQGSSVTATYSTQNSVSAPDSVAKLAWLDGTLNQVFGDLSEDELRVFAQVRDRVQRQQSGELMTGQPS